MFLLENVGRKRLKGRMVPKKTKFQEYLEMEMNMDQDDLETERRLEKKLKVKGGKLGGFDDGMNELFDGIPSVLDTTPGGCADNEEDVMKESVEIMQRKRKKKKKKDEVALDVSTEKPNMPIGVSIEIEQPKICPNSCNSSIKSKNSEGSAKYVPPHLRCCTHESEELSHIRRRVRGLLNRLSESNVESITGEVASIFRSISRSNGCQIIGEEVLSSCSNGPRGNEQYASVFAAFVAGMACSVGMDFSAKLIASLATLFEREYTEEDNLSLRNITLLLCYLCIFGVCSSDLIYDFLSILSKRLTELDVSTILTVLQCCGMKLRADDPMLMKEFILNIQSKVSEMKAMSGSSEETELKIKNKRMEFMLETICDIKNNKKRSKDDPAHHTRIKNWLRKLKADDILLRGLKWNKLLNHDKKGQWWLMGEFTSTEDHVEEVAVTIEKEVMETQKLMQLATAQRMNTDVRRAIFCIIVSGEDYMDAFEKILRLNLSGKQDREIMRVLLECCLQEKVFNKYYCVLASKLCSHDKNHKFTLQYCVWDHFKEVDTMELRRSMNLAKFVSEMLCSFSLSLSLLKTVDLTDPKQLTPKRIMHFRMLFETLLGNSDAVVWNIFSRVATISEQEILGQSIEFFIKQFVLSSKTGKSLTGKFKIAKKALGNLAGVLL